MRKSSNSLVVHAGAVWLLTLAFSAPVAFAQTSSAGVCGSLDTAYGPYDYRTQRDKLSIVEKHHFGPVVESLLGGQEGYLGGDLSYVLAAFPNHHRALIAVMKFGEKTKSPQPPHMTYSVECYFVRALQFQRDDTVARMLYAQYLGKQQRKPEAITQLEAVAKLAGDNPFTIYNTGLIYHELGEFDRAVAAAQKAASLGFSRPELEALLRKDGKWTDAEPAATGTPETKP